MSRNDIEETTGIAATKNTPDRNIPDRSIPDSALQAAGDKQRAYTDMLLESCPNIIILLDASGCFVLSTKIFLSAINIPNSDSIKGRSYEEILSKYFSGDDMEFLKAAINRITSPNEILMFDAWVDFYQKGQPRFYSVKLRRAVTGIADSPDAMFGTLVVMEDLTDFMREKQRAEFANRAKSDFLAVMSHELRTPLNSIVGFSELAMKDDIHPKTKEYLEQILENSHWLLVMINDILDISKIESGKIQLESIPFDLNELFAICQTLTKPKALEKGLTLILHEDPPAGFRLLGDPTRLRQVLVNLLSNAIKFTDSGAVEVSSSVVSDNDKTITVRFAVKDNGIGMTEEQKKIIFEPFRQADASTTRKYGGTGLGLTISKNLIELMGGELFVESSPGNGSNFSFILTFNKAGSLDHNLENKTATNFIGKPVFKGTVLICEDNNMNQKLICDYLSRVGLDTVVASNGVEAVGMVERCIKNNEKPFDLIFMDIHMPVMDGFEAASRIAQLDIKIPIVALTAINMTHDRLIYKAAGMDDFMEKPFKSQDLWRCLLKYFTPLNRYANGGILPDQMDKELLLQLRTDFVMDNQTTFGEIIDTAGNGNITLAYRLAHTLESSAGLIGEKELQKAAGNAAALLKDRDSLFREACLNALESELKSVLEKLSPLIESSAALKPSDTQTVSCSQENALRLIRQIEPLINNGNPECLDFIEDLRVLPGGSKLVKQMEDYDFNLAIDSLSELKSKLGEFNE